MKTLRNIAQKTPLVGSALVATTILTNIPHMTGDLAQQTGMSLGDATLAITTLLGGGIEAAIVLFPVIAPFIGTLDGLILIIGVAATAGW